MEETPNRTLEQAMEDWSDRGKVFATWQYLTIFIAPAILTFAGMFYYANVDMLISSIVALAVMNGSINSMIAYLTIRLDDKSSEALEHLTLINEEMEKLEDTLDEANKMVSSFTGDLDEAKARFGQVGVDLEAIDSVISKLKENENGLNNLLDSLKEVDVTGHLEQAKRIDWKSLLDSAEEVMGFIQTHIRQAETSKTFKTFKPTLEPIVPLDEDVWNEEEPDWVKHSVADYASSEPRTPPKLTLARDKPLTLKRR